MRRSVGVGVRKKRKSVWRWKQLRCKHNNICDLQQTGTNINPQIETNMHSLPSSWGQRGGEGQENKIWTRNKADRWRGFGLGWAQCQCVIHVQTQTDTHTQTHKKHIRVYLKPSWSSSTLPCSYYCLFGEIKLLTPPPICWRLSALLCLTLQHCSLPTDTRHSCSWFDSIKHFILQESFLQAWTEQEDRLGHKLPTSTESDCFAFLWVIVNTCRCCSLTGFHWRQEYLKPRMRRNDRIVFATLVWP